MFTSKTIQIEWTIDFHFYLREFSLMKNDIWYKYEILFNSIEK